MDDKELLLFDMLHILVRAANDGRGEFYLQELLEKLRNTQPFYADLMNKFSKHYKIEDANLLEDKIIPDLDQFIYELESNHFGWNEE